MEKQKKIKRCASDRVLITIFYILVQRIINNCYIKPMPLPLH